MSQKTLNDISSEIITKLFGNFDEKIKIVEYKLKVKILNRSYGLIISGNDDDVEKAIKVLFKMQDVIKLNDDIDTQQINYIVDLVCDGNENSLSLCDDVILISSKGIPIKPKTVGQYNYTKLIKNNSVVFGVGPAGTGKTYLAVAMAVKAFKKGFVDKIILTRPAVEAGEKLGFLPGDLQDKVDPYLRPLYDALFDFFGLSSYTKYIENNVIEIAPLAYMRGRTLSDAFVILDEAQNTTKEQMKMFLTRLGTNSNAVITGDITQVDLPYNKTSGLVTAVDILKDIDGIAIHYFNEKDVVRHRLVKEIIKAYEKLDRRNE